MAGNSIQEPHRHTYSLTNVDSHGKHAFHTLTIKNRLLADSGDWYRPGQAILGHVAIRNDIEIPLITRKQPTLTLGD